MNTNSKVSASLRYLSALACAIAIHIAAAATSIEGTSPDPDYNAYVKPANLVALQDGRKIHLFCLGTGSPTVVLTAGFSDWSAQWNKVHASIAQKTRACSWDRAGYGYSDPSPMPQDIDHTTADLEAALAVAKIDGPCVMVGHSMGAYESLRFADRHRDQVVGMVLVDPSIPDQYQRTKTAAPELSLALEATHAQYVQKKNSCAAQVKKGTLTATSADPDMCLSYNSSYPEELKNAMRRMDGNPARWLTRASLMSNLNRSSQEIVDRKRNYSDLPLRVLTAGERDTFPSNIDAAAVAQIPTFEAEMLHGHDALAALSTKGVNIVVPGTTHYIQLIKPDFVISTILKVVDEAQANP